MNNDAGWREAFLREFGRVRTERDLHPAGRTAAATFDAASETARAVAEECLPLGVGVVMHLYPLCASRCVPLPWWSRSNYLRTRLLHEIDRRALILANAGSERAGASVPAMLTRGDDGVRVDGAFEYVSLANVADIVMFTAPLAGGGNLFCAADLRGESVTLGAPRFSGSMRLSDTCSVRFANHRVPDDRHLAIPTESDLHCMGQYQRSWFQLLLAEGYRARVERLRRQWELPDTDEHVASLNELGLLREFARHQLDNAASAGAIDSLARVTAAMKLRTSWHAQSTAAALAEIDPVSAAELGYLRRQPSSDDRILASLSASGRARSSAAPAAR